MVNDKTSNGSGFRLLETKFFIPKWRSGSVQRPQLIARLEDDMVRPVTLVTAPAGSGKTTLLAEWLTASSDQDRSLSWVSLDASENDPALFWTYLITALQRSDPAVGQDALAILASSRPPPIEHVLTVLLNDLVATRQRIVLVLDDVHVLESAAIHSGLEFLIDGLPDHIHLVLISRSDPPIPLARMRARGEISEIRVADLRFSADEANRFFQDAMRLDLSNEETQALQNRTEGWIAGLQLAALSLRGNTDRTSFVQAFSGDDRYIVDYLIEEVLQRQTPELRLFLLQTSIVERLSGPLCNAITGEQNSRQNLDYLDRANLFLIPLDNRREWFRYHHLFADVLRTVLAAESPDLVPALHDRASQWFEANNLPANAIRHTLLSGNAARAADLIELVATGMRQQRQETTLLSWIEQIPEGERYKRPVLTSVHGALLLQTGKFDRVESMFSRVEELLANPGPDVVVADHAEFDRLPASLAVHRSGMALVLGEHQLAAERAQVALTVVGPDDHLYRGAAESIKGLAAWYEGDLEAAWWSFNRGMESLYLAGSILDTVGGMIIGGDLLITLGRLHEAARVFQNAIARTEQHGQPRMRGAADMYTGLGTVSLAWNDLEATRQYLAQSRSLGEAASFPQNPWRVLALDANLQVAKGNFSLAIDLLDEAKTIYTGDFSPEFRPIHAQKARVWIRAGDLDQANRWAHEHNLTLTGDAGYLHEFEQITLARLLLARHRNGGASASLADAAELLNRLLASAQAGGRMSAVIELLILKAQVQAEQGHRSAALATLNLAVAAAEPERHARVFIDEGDSVRVLLREVDSSYARHLLAMFTEPTSPAPSPVPVPANGMVESLTTREREILQLIAAGLRNEEIADRLFISLATVKRHIANTYGKLGVTHRTEAVAKANALGLLT